jgi:hypothetical protein
MVCADINCQQINVHSFETDVQTYTHIYVYIYIYTYTHTHIRLRYNARIYISTTTQVYMQRYVLPYIYTHWKTHCCTPTHTYICTYAHTHTHTHTCYAHIYTHIKYTLCTLCTPSIRCILSLGVSHIQASSLSLSHFLDVHTDVHLHSCTWTG